MDLLRVMEGMDLQVVTVVMHLPLQPHSRVIKGDMADTVKIRDMGHTGSLSSLHTGNSNLLRLPVSGKRCKIMRGEHTTTIARLACLSGKSRLKCHKQETSLACLLFLDILTCLLGELIALITGIPTCLGDACACFAPLEYVHMLGDMMYMPCSG